MTQGRVSRAIGAFVVIAAGMLVLAAPASATFVFSNVTYTKNSLTFTIDGDMTGYTTPSISSNQFSIRMLGDIFGGPSSGYSSNAWSSSPFDNRAPEIGNIFNAANTTPYVWARFDDDLGGAVSTSNTVTLSWAVDWLNESATDTGLEFLWGNGNDMSEATLLARVDASSPVPEPTTLLLLGLGLGGLGFARRRPH